MIIRQMSILAIFLTSMYVSKGVAQTKAPPNPSPAASSQYPSTSNSESVIETLQRKTSSLQARLQDWPDLARYRTDDAIVPLTTADQQRVVFLGDSIFDGWGHPIRSFPGKPYINRGIGGQTTPQMLIRFRPDVIALHPYTVVILAGTNDIAGNTGPETDEEIEDNYHSMGDLAKAAGIRVVFASVTPVCGDKIDGRPPARILALNQWLKSYTQQEGFVYLDYYSAMLDDHGMLRREITRDCLHPNDAGYAVMAPLTDQAILNSMELH